MVQRYATIDIGTNTILILIAESDNKETFKVITDEHSLARLGQGIGSNHKRILDEAIERAKKILINYKSICNKYNVEKIYAVATSAMRDAENRDDVKRTFEEIIDSEIEIISGEKEARFSFSGAIEDDNDSVVIDIGGGSTEIIFGNMEVIKNRFSLQIGAVRIKEQYSLNNPVEEANLIKAENAVNKELSFIKNIHHYVKVYAVAGTPTTLAGILMNLKEFDRNFIQGYQIKIDDIKQLFDRFCQMTVEEIINEYSVNPNRADVITAGTMILIKILEHINSDKCIASTKGLRYGMMKYLISK
ncbi:hypothetical protein D9V86_06230 [Bacteroidetes/Chlorobi group bacterium ChocPot_Mid]|nr:MAG: hypothetical protein D9V86_06230 [Bacteroidetes/Chlorobi group bacterium ChocPot_Mid]